jgi:hypothetical protein
MVWERLNSGGLDELPHLYLAELVRQMRGAGTHRSTAEVIEGVRLARTLAALHEGALPWSSESIWQFWRKQVKALSAFSTKTTCSAPRLRASNPTDPDPAHKSKKRDPGILSARILKSACRALPEVGRVKSDPEGVFKGRPLCRPPVILNPMLLKLILKGGILKICRG